MSHQVLWGIHAAAREEMERWVDSDTEVWGRVVTRSGLDPWVKPQKLGKLQEKKLCRSPFLYSGQVKPLLSFSQGE